MAIDIKRISKEQKEKILIINEGHFSELKAIEIRPAKLTRTICAFANADGGELYIGIDEDKDTKTRTWRGFENQEAANSHIQTFEALFPLGQEYSYTFLSCDDNNTFVLLVEVQKTQTIKSATDETIYLRRGAQNLPIKNPEEIRQLEYDKGITSFESNTIDMQSDIITNSVMVIDFMLQVIPTAEPIDWLKKQCLIKNEKPTVSGILLFAEEPQAVIPKKSGIKVYRYKTQAEEGTRDTLDADPITIEGCLYNQIKMSVKKTVEIVEGIQKLGPNGFENISYPFETLHEIITNAVIHRDYSIADDTHVRIFDNRIEVQSPGTLPGHITVDNILKERFARNPAIVRILNKFPDPPNKDVGEGLNTAFQAMKKLHLREPIIKQTGNNVLVIIKHEPLASPEEVIMKYLDINGKINNSAAREICSIGSENIMKRVFQRMMASNLIEIVPGLKGKARAYQKKANSYNSEPLFDQHKYN
jgi:ATP-dependent DNA helicase RecG